MTEKKKGILEVPCEFGGMSAGKETVSIGLTVARANLSLETADELFVNKRLTMKLIQRKKSDDPKQTVMPELHLNGTFDTSSLSAKLNTLGTRLTGKLKTEGGVGGVDASDLVKFANREGFVHIEGAADIPDGEAGAAE